MTVNTKSWEDRCRRDLMAALTSVRAALERRVEPAAELVHVVPDSEPSSLERLCRAFGLSSFERSLLLLCAGFELCPEFPSLCSAVNEDSRMSYPTFSLALTVFADPDWSALTPTSALRRWRLIEVGAGDRLTSNPLRIDERILHYLLGVSYLDERLQGLIESCDSPAEIPESQRTALLKIVDTWSAGSSLANLPVIRLCGNDSSGKRSVAAAAATALGLRLCAVRAADLPAASAEREAFARLWEREALLSECALLIDDEDSNSFESTRALVPFIEAAEGLLFVTGHEPLRSRRRRIVRVDVNRPNAGEQKAIWKSALGPAAERLNGQLDVLATQFDLTCRSITEASEEVLQQWQRSDGAELAPLLWQACRRQSRPKLGDLAERIEPAAGWEDLVLPQAQLQIIRNIAAHVRWRALVYDGWGFASKGVRGLGISALFSGASGTGKTMTAEVLANELKLDLYRIDLSAMVSKYIGETEKNLRRVFDAAEEGGAILLFDEADALFGKRSEVKDSHDRYANIEISYLLQRVEAYRGLAILTSNLKNALDSAFLRRIRFIVHFPFPDTSQRVEIWRRIFPDGTPTDALNLEKLAQLNLSGGNIRNLALHAAFFAADAGEPVRMDHLLAAARSEYSKLEKTLSESDLGGWV